MPTDRRGGYSSEPRRQARGQRRIEQIRNAAAAVFAERGYDAATTNAIATQADISPGSLCQFFDNKDEIAQSLAEHWAGTGGNAPGNDGNHSDRPQHDAADHRRRCRRANGPRPSPASCAGSS